MPEGQQRYGSGTDRYGNPAFINIPFRVKKRKARKKRKKGAASKKELLAIDISKLTIKKIK